eukprot:CAMPEP_0201282810 /NCGR_PEP_ID=MMETSP1317-20130820/6757_1 /ASSEMBLY_ACC=CAM_ASM_000770 /TAXON_ID=187299 /ORGANISM="Undescribed Undescribed, Strain Undescribed" /LENGTH=126 /DNA_ID=CAMNT_0047596821 /DNA_START=111 /DNA_END=488 /DNA_ORIENTATION=-
MPNELFFHEVCLFRLFMQVFVEPLQELLEHGEEPPEDFLVDVLAPGPSERHHEFADLVIDTGERSAQSLDAEFEVVHPVDEVCVQRLQLVLRHLHYAFGGHLQVRHLLVELLQRAVLRAVLRQCRQ